MIALIADGKIYVGTHEHSADTPLYKGEKVKALNATTGEEIWSMSGWGYPMTFAAADGVLIYWNNYDGQIYAIGKGPSALTVEAPKAAIDLGSSLIISGTVTIFLQVQDKKSKLQDSPTESQQLMKQVNHNGWIMSINRRADQPTQPVYQFHLT